MKTINGGEEYGWTNGPHYEDPDARLAAQANSIFKKIAATMHIGRLVLPVEVPRPPDLSLN